jgi:transcriptional regulator with XRE-family HTH domain
MIDNDTKLRVTPRPIESVFVHHAQSHDFAEYLRSAIRSAGFATPTQFARKAELDPSVVLRWLGGSQRPTVRSLERVAPILGRSTSEMVQAAYPGRLDSEESQAAPMHELGYEVGRLLSEDSPLPPEERKFLERFLNTVLEPYRQEQRPRRSRRRSTNGRASQTRVA